MRYLLALLTAAILCCAQSVPARAGQIELTVAAAASLTNAFSILALKFEAQNPGVTVKLCFGPSHELLRHIENGTKADIFASADGESMDKAEQAGLLLPHTRAAFATNELALIVPRGATVRPSTAKGLRHESVRRIAIANPETAAAGRYTREVLIKAAEWEALTRKYVQGQHVREVLEMVMRGEVDAGIVYVSDAHAAQGSVQTMGLLREHAPIRFTLAVLNQSAHPELARRFAAFVHGAEGRDVLTGQGFAPLP